MKAKLSRLVIKVKSFSPEKLFLLFAIPLGLLFIIIHPIGEVPDEFTHFMRIYGISEGALIAEQTETNSGGSSLPSGLIEINQTLPTSGTYAEVGADFARPNTDERSDYNYVTAALYNPICYAPQVIGVLLGKLFNFPYVLQAYIGRIFNFTTFLILIFFAIKLLPKFKNWLLFLSLLPITLQEAASLAPDALTIGICFFLIAFIAHLIYDEKKSMSRRELIVLYVLAFIIGLCKIVYLPLVLLYFAIPSERFGGKRQKIIHAFIIGFLTIAINLAWLSVSSRYLVELSTGANPELQLSNLLANPFNYLVTLARSVEKNLEFYLASGFGLRLGHFAINLPSIFLWISFAFSILLLAQNAEHLKIKLFERILFTVTSIIICGLIMTSLYLQWTPVGSNIVEGVQGRYFLPVLPILPFIINSNRPKIICRSIIRTRHILAYLAIFNLVGLTEIFIKNL